MTLSEKFFELFLGYSKHRGEYKPAPPSKIEGKKAKGSGITVEGGATPDIWQRHLEGIAPGLGIIPLMDEDEVVFGAIDVDTYPFDHIEFEKKVRSLNLPLWLFKSKSGGCHLMVFLKEPVMAVFLVEKLQEFKALLGISYVVDKDGKNREVEVFPKQIERDKKGGIGNWLNMPYFGKERPAIYNGKELTQEEFIELVWDKRLSAQELKQAGKKIEETFPGGPPCLNMLVSEGLIDNYKNNFLFNVAVYLRQRFPDNWEGKLYSHAEHLLDAPAPRAEVENIIKQVSKKSHTYMCKEPPICDKCNRSACVNKAYGIASLDENTFVQLDGLTKLIDPAGGDPMYSINANGRQIVLSGRDELLNQKRFLGILFDRLSILGTEVKAKDWADRLRVLVENIEETYLPTNATPEGILLEHLAEYIDKRSRNVHKIDEITTGRVFLEDITDNGRKDKVACFTSSPFFEYVRQNNFRDLNTREMYKALASFGVKRAQLNIAKKNVAYWRVSLGKISSILSNQNNIEFKEIPKSTKNQHKSILQEEPFDTPDVSRKF